MCLYSHYSALLGKHQHPPGWCTLWPHRTLGQRMTEARRAQCTLLPQCSWKMSRRDMSLSGEASVNPTRKRNPSVFMRSYTNQQQRSPKSISSRAALAPSTRIFLLGPVRAWCMKYTPSVTRGRNLSAYPWKSVTPTSSYIIATCAAWRLQFSVWKKLKGEVKL